MKRVISALLCLLLLGCAPVRQAAKGYLRQEERQWSPSVPFSKMDLSFLNPSAMLVTAQSLQQNLPSLQKKEAVSAFEDLCSQYAALLSAVTLAHVRYCRNVMDQTAAADFQRLDKGATALQHALVKLEIELMDRFSYHAEAGEAYRQRLLEALSQSSPAMEALREQESALCRAYENLNATVTVEAHGRTWTYEQLMADESMSFGTFLSALDAYEAEWHRQAGNIFLELMDVRKAMAPEGKTYAQSQYEAFGRAYSPKTALAASQIIKRRLVPLFRRLRENCDGDLLYLGSATFREDVFLSAMGEASEQVVPGAKGILEGMLALGLYDSAPSAHKVQGSFTTYIAAYESPYLFTQWEETASDVFTVIHEFGHYLSFALNPQGSYFGRNDLDVAEADAQTFELLMTDRYASLFGRYKTAAKLCWLNNALYALLSGCMEDEFQQLAYAMEQPTLEELDALYHRLVQEYGFDLLFGYEGQEWTKIHHTLEYPFYYISYSTSMMAALRLYAMGNKGMQRLLTRSAQQGLMDVVGEDMFSPQALEETVRLLERMANDWLEEQ